MACMAVRLTVPEWFLPAYEACTVGRQAPLPTESSRWPSFGVFKTVSLGPGFPLTCSVAKKDGLKLVTLLPLDLQRTTDVYHHIQFLWLFIEIQCLCVALALLELTL